MRMYATEPTRLESLSQAMIYSQYCQQHGDNKERLEKMKKHLYIAIKQELTPRQCYCITEYYLNGRKIKSLAEELGITPSVVSRHISRGVVKLKKSLPYFDNTL
ncbi:MAG: sigma factor-like helix-turn-helix DNA-binding protein [Acutalibacteraceae bacterium]|nr:sigma factor-like helix-turn-helix DNA-binding protein [Acutalibacteraceae bacterium]